jgi:putative spermidine/putrescine transport system ATP-binding protein
MTMSDRIAVFNKGRVEQCGAPGDLYDRPTNLFVAGFVGENNFLDARVAGQANGTVKAESVAGTMLASRAETLDGRCIVAVRPERVIVDPPAQGGMTHLEGKVAERYFAGDHVRLVVMLKSGEEVAVKASRLDAASLPNPGDATAVGWRAADAYAFAPEITAGAVVPNKELQPA